MKRIICFVLVLLMVGSLFASCANGGEAGVETSGTADTSAVSDTEAANDSSAETDPAETTAELTTEVTTELVTEAETEPPVVLTEFDLSKFRIVYKGDDMKSVADELQRQIKTKTNIELEVISNADAKEAADYEFVIGKTNRAISTTCFNFKKFDYVNCVGIYCEDGKVQFLGIDRATARDSVKYLANTIVEGATTVGLPESGAFCEAISLADNGIPEKADSSYLRVVTNNIRMCSITETSSSAALQNRVTELMSAYLLMDPDVIMFQEADKAWYTDYALVKNMRDIGYSYVSTKQDTNPVALFYKTDRFNMLEADFVKYDSSMIEGGPYSGRYYTYAVLEENGTGKQIVVTSTHFVAGITNVSTEICEIYRQESAKQLSAFSKTIRDKYPKASVIMGGDYNSDLSSESFRIMSESLLYSRDTAEKTVNMNYQTTNSLGKKPARGNPPKVIDHIFYTNTGLTVKHYEVVVSKYSYVYSDHVPVLVDFEW